MVTATRINTNRITDGSVTTNKIGVGAITGNLLSTSIINSNNIVDGAILGNDIAVNAVRGNNIVAGTITGNLIASNVNLSIIRVLETANIYSTAVGGNVNIDISNNTVYFFSANATANVTFNLRANGNNGGILDSLISVGQSVSTAILLKQGSTRYRANVYVDGVLQSPLYIGNVAPGYIAATQQESIDNYSFTVLKTAANTYTILAANSNFQYARNQNP